MATNWNAVLSNINSLSDILAILRKVLASLDSKVDLTKIDEIIADISTMQIYVDTALNNVNSSLSEFDTESQEAIQQVIAAGLMEGFATEAELLATRPNVLKKYAKAEDTDVIWFWNKPEGAPDGNYWTSTGLSELDRAKNYTDTKTLGFNESLLDSIKSFGSSLSFKGVVINGETEPDVSSIDDCYLVIETGVAFSIEVESGQLLIKTGEGWRVGDFLEKYRSALDAYGGICALTTLNSYLINGYINNSGAFAPSSAGFKLTYFKPVKPGDSLKFSARGSTSANVVSFWDTNRSFISGVLGNDSNAERTVVVPANAVYVRICNVMTSNASPYCNAVIDSLINSSGAVKQNDFTVEASLNLARPEYIINDFYVNNTGSISAGAGWKYIKIPVIVGKTYTFGGFGITTSGYYSVLNAASNATLMYGSYQTGTLPKTITIPEDGAWLAFDVCRPQTDPSLYAQHRAFEGGVLLDYVEPIDTILRIKGLKLAGTSDGGETPIPENVVTQGGNAVLADIIADSITIAALFSNLPLANDPDLQIGQFYEDENGFVKVNR